MGWETKRDAYIKGTFRKVWRWSPERREVLNDAKVDDKYKCSQCKKLFGKKKIKVDHIDPVVEVKTGFQDWNTYFKRMFVGKEGLQLLCDDCHDVKSKEENKERRKIKNERKNSGKN